MSLSDVGDFACDENVLSDEEFQTPRPHGKPKPVVKKTPIVVSSKCKTCGKKITLKSNCVRHEKTCGASDKSNEKFSCKTCSASYSRLDNLSAHLKKCNPISSDSHHESLRENVNKDSSSHESSFEDDCSEEVNMGNCREKQILSYDDFETLKPNGKPKPVVKKTSKCQNCGKIFTFRSNCVRHEKSCCSSEQSKKFSCESCSASFSRLDNLSTHLKKCKLYGKTLEDPRKKNVCEVSSSKTMSSEDNCSEDYVSDIEVSNLKSKEDANSKSDQGVEVCGNSSSAYKSCSSKKTKTLCLADGCSLEFYHKTGLIAHLESAHKSTITLKKKMSPVFKSIDEFNVWKQKEEESTFSYFCQKKGQSGSRIKQFYCQHDGTAKVHSSRKTDRRNRKGRIKVGHFCIAKMRVLKGDDGQIHVEYFPTHSHQCSPKDFQHQPLPESTSRFIDKQLKWSVSPSKIYKHVQDMSVPKNTEKIQFVKNNILTKKRIRERCRRMRNARRLHRDDAKAVYLLAKQLADDENSVLIYKPYGGEIVIGPSDVNKLPDSRDIFMFGLQTERQLELMKQHCAKIVIVDETHGTNQYKYQLLNVMVVDENRRGWPVAHLITSKSDALTLKFFFECLKSRLGKDVNINCVITDDAPALINAMNEGFSEELRHILCKWHVLKNFKENLRSKVSKDLYEPMMSELRVIMNAADETLFSQLCSGFLKKYETNSSASFFISYFQQNYLNRAEKWAMCFRRFPHGGVNTTGHVESFHHRLKKVYLKRKVNKRLDDLIYILRDIEWDDHCTRFRESTLGLANLPQPIMERHHRGVLIPDEDVVEVLEYTWEVNSVSSKNLKHVVERYSSTCSSDLCFSNCQNLSCSGLCAHLYGCSCLDQHPLCKHIHKVHSLMTRGQTGCTENEEFYVLPQEPENNEDITLAEEEVNEALHGKFKRESMIKRLEGNLFYLNSFLEAAQKNQVSENSLTYTDATVKELVSRLQSLTTSEDDTVVPMQPSLTFNSNEKLQTQLSQLARFRVPAGKRKRKVDVAEQSRKKAAAIKNLLSCFDEENTENDGSEDYDSEHDIDSPNNVPFKVTALSENGFTLPDSYVPDPLDVVLQCGEEKISLIHLKSLELAMSPEDVKRYQKKDPIFQPGWLYSCVINAFMYQITEKAKDVFYMSSNLAIRASNDVSNINILKESASILQTKEIILLPANITNNQWMMIVILIKEGKIMLYDPLQQNPSGKCCMLLSRVTDDMRALFPNVSTWIITQVEMPKEDDVINCGPNICHFAEQISLCRSYSPIESNFNFRLHMYQCIIGNCMKRSSYYDEFCGKCGAQYGNDEDPTQVWVSCKNCNQWFHGGCVAYLSSSCNTFICS